MNNTTLKDAIDVLENMISDYVIGEYCASRKCSNFDNCEDDCYFEKAIDTVLRAIKIKDEYSKLLLMTLCDFDGANSEKELKDLIKEIMDYLKMSLDNDDKFPAYLWEGKNFNILHEEVKDE